MAAQVLIGLSGGVDSAVAAWKLRESGVDVDAVFMKNWEEDDTEEYCAAAKDLADAEAVCEKLDLRLHAINFSAEYWDRVFTVFLAEYSAGRTPNPDILCNREIKFRAFLDYARSLGAERIATGHYAGIRLHGPAFELIQAEDRNKDQTYFLHRLDQEQLAAAHFPLQGMTKEETRRQARRIGLPVHNKKDSTGICFIGERRFQDFLASYIPAEPGPIVDVSGRKLGEYRGLAFQTIGQRTGLGIGGVSGGGEGPWYVVAKDMENGQVTVTQDRNHPALNVRTLEIESPHWIAGAPPEGRTLKARIRHRQPLQDCRLEQDGNLCRACFAEPQWAPAPGQSVVFYLGEVCLGGGVILKTLCENGLFADHPSRRGAEN